MYALTALICKFSNTLYAEHTIWRGLKNRQLQQPSTTQHMHVSTAIALQPPHNGRRDWSELNCVISSVEFSCVVRCALSLRLYKSHVVSHRHRFLQIYTVDGRRSAVRLRCWILHVALPCLSLHHLGHCRLSKSGVACSKALIAY